MFLALYNIINRTCHLSTTCRSAECLHLKFMDYLIWPYKKTDLILIMNIKTNSRLAILLLFIANSTLFAQKDTNLNSDRVITPSFPFLLINNDQQTTGLAEASVGLLQYNNSGIDNPAKILFNKNDYYASLNHSNYLGSLVNDMSISSAFLNFKM